MSRPMSRQKKRYIMARCITAVVLLFATLISTVLPIGFERPKKAQAAKDTIYVDGIGEVRILYDGGRQYQVGLDEYNNLVIQGGYNHNSSALLSYHTTYLYFTTGKAYGNPTAASNYYSIYVGAHEASQTVDADGKVWDTYVVDGGQIYEMIATLFGEDGVSKEQTVFMSEGYSLKKRATKDDDWDILDDKTYNTLDGIRNAAGWSDTTYLGFANYFDVQLGIQLQPYPVTVNVEPAAGGYLSRSESEAYSGDNVSIHAAAEKGWEFDKWTVDAGGVTLSSTTSMQTSFTMPLREVVLTAHFKEKPKPPEVRPPDASPTPIPEVTATPEPTPTPIPQPPQESSQVTKEYDRYFTTDLGYTMQAVYNNTIEYADSYGGYLAAVMSATGGCICKKTNL